jgi:hypothetical protein
MDIRDFRKTIFINSQYCTYCIENGNTVLAGIMRNVGYKYAEKFSPEKIQQMNATYRKYTTIMNSIVGLEIILYLYLFMFPNFLNLMQLPFFIAAITLCAIPLIALYLTYIVINNVYEKYLNKTFGEFQKTKFSPTIYNVEPQAYETYLKTSKKSVYVLAFIIIIFAFYTYTPILIDNLVAHENYQSALTISNIFSKIVPIQPDIYAQRAYTKFKLKDYKNAIADFELANAYSKSNAFDLDILGVKLYYLPFDEMINEFDRKIADCEKKHEKEFFMDEKANYLMKHKKYAQALSIYNELLKTYAKGEYIAFSADEVFYNRGLAKKYTGDLHGASIDMQIAHNMCQSCTFDYETKLIRKP